MKSQQSSKKSKLQKKSQTPGIFEQLWRALICPSSKVKYLKTDLGPEVFFLAKTHTRRQDFQVINSRGHKIECSYFEPVKISNIKHPCVIYLHGNCSSRLEGISLLEYLLPLDMSVILLDFSGCGMSEGQYISLGFFEKQDVGVVIEWLKQSKPFITSIGIWGRSMGAATALMIGTSRNDVDMVVADSSYKNIPILCQEIAKRTYKCPKFILKIAYYFIRKKVISKANFDLNQCNTYEAIANAKFLPSILFLAAEQDTLISYQHSKDLFSVYKGPKNIRLFEGTHNSRRPNDVHQYIAQCFQKQLSGKSPLSPKMNLNRIQQIVTPDEPNSQGVYKKHFQMEQAPKIQHDSDDDNIIDPEYDMQGQNSKQINLSELDNKENKIKQQGGIGIQLHFQERTSGLIAKPLSVQTNYDLSSDLNGEIQNGMNSNIHVQSKQNSKLFYDPKVENIIAANHPSTITNLPQNNLQSQSKNPLINSDAPTQQNQLTNLKPNGQVKVQ